MSKTPAFREIQELFGSQPRMIWVKTADAAIAGLKSAAIKRVTSNHRSLSFRFKSIDVQVDQQLTRLHGVDR